MAIEAQGTTLEISGSAAVADTITVMTLSYPTVLTSVAHSIANGDVVTLADFAGVDAGDLNGETPVAQFVTTDTFAVPIDTTDKTITVGSATATPAAWITIGESTGFAGPGGSASIFDITHLGSTAKEKMIGLPDEGQYTFDINWILDTDAGQQAALTARNARTLKNFRVVYSDDSTLTFAGYVLGMNPTGGVDDKVSGSVTIEITGAANWSSI